MRMFMSFNCYDVPALKIAIAAFNPTSLLELLGADAYDASISDLANLYLIYNFVHEHFWSDTGSDIPMPVPCASWHEYRDHYSDITAQIFPESSALAQPAARGTAYSSRSVASASHACSATVRPPPPYALHSDTTLAAREQQRRSRTPRTRDPGKSRDTTYQSSSPNMIDGTPIAPDSTSVSSQIGGVKTRHDARSRKTILLMRRR